MAVSLLFLNESNFNNEPLHDKILSHLFLDRSFSYICPDEKKRKRFLKILCRLTDNKEEIIYRQNIIKDFHNNPTFFEQLSSMFKRFENLYVSQKNIVKDEYLLSATKMSSSMASKNILQMQALCLKRALLFIKGFGELIENYDLKASGLKYFYNECFKIYDSSDFSKLLMFCSRYENFSMNGFWDFKFTLNNEGYISEYELIDHKYTRIPFQQPERRPFLFFKKNEESRYQCSQLNVKSGEVYDELAIAALSDISRLISKLSEQIFSRFESIFYELEFYDVAIKYINILSNKNIMYCYPVFCSDGCCRVKKLYDLYLLLSKSNNIIPNDFEMTCRSSGLIIFGSNGSGKTVYLRSIGTMQILAQAGLPIPCESASVTLFSRIATCFSEGEKQFNKGNSAGRFEHEVSELAVMVDTLQEGSLVFLNEIFQSTNYSEGTEALYHLLKFFSDSQIRWILVSHLKQLENFFGQDEVTIKNIYNGKILE